MYPPEWKINLFGEAIELRRVSPQNASILKTLVEAMRGEIRLELEEPTSSSRYRVVIRGPLFTDSEKIARRFVKAVKDDHRLTRVKIGFQRFL
jgi:hypothetical protein